MNNETALATAKTDVQHFTIEAFMAVCFGLASFILGYPRYGGLWILFGAGICGLALKYARRMRLLKEASSKTTA